MNDEVKKQYQLNIQVYQPKRRFFSKGVKAFFVGGVICTIGQLLNDVYLTFMPLSEKKVTGVTLATLIFLAALLTAFGIYDKLGQFAGAGALVPVTGFSNAMTSAALEHRSEGLVHGVGANMFKITGAVLAFGVLAAYVVALTRLLVQFLIQT